MTFIVQGRTDPRKPAARITIGPYGVFTVDQARDVAREHARSMRMGIDPRAMRKQEAAEGVTLKQVYDSYVGRPGALKPSTAKWYEFFVTKVFADWQDKPVVSITRDMVKERHAQLAREGLKGKKVKGAAPGSANSAMVVLRIQAWTVFHAHRPPKPSDSELASLRVDSDYTQVWLLGGLENKPQPALLGAAHHRKRPTFPQ
jgi:hypothetical protein